MEAWIKWKTGMNFEGSTGGHTVSLDSKAPLGKDEGFTPKELVAIGLGGCTAMDVIALLKKYRQPVDEFSIKVVTEARDEGHPVTFAKADLVFQLRGKIEKDKLLEAIRLSQTKYCGVSAMLSKAHPIRYSVELNGEVIGQGEAHFD